MKDGHRAGAHLQSIAAEQGAGAKGIRAGGVEHQTPPQAGGQLRQALPMCLPVGIDRQQNQVVGGVVLVPAGEEHADLPGLLIHLGVPGCPVVKGHRGPAAPGRGGLSADNGVCFAEGDHLRDKVEQILVVFQPGPVQPGNLVVLTVGVVVAELGVGKFVPRQEHGSAPAAQQHGEGVFYQPVPKGQHLRIRGVSLHAAVPAVVVVGPVGVAPAVGLVVLDVVGVQVVQGKAVVAGEEVHRGVLPLGGGIQVGGAGDALDRRPGQTSVSLQEAAQVVPVLAVPFCPPVPGGKGPHLIQSAGVPGLGNELHPAQDGIEGQTLQQGRFGQGSAVGVPAQNGGKVKPEPVHPVLHHPVPQTVQNELTHHRMVAVEGVAHAGEVIILAVGGEHIVDVVVQPLEGEEGALLVAFGGVVDHHVQNNLNAVLVEGAD